MREWILVAFSVIFVIALLTNLIVALAIIPSTFLSYWVWKDEEEIKALKERVSLLVRHKADRED